MHVKKVWSCHKNLCKDYESTIFQCSECRAIPVVYVDNYLEGDSCGSYLKNVNDTTIMLGALGFATDTKFNILRFYHKL